MLALFSDNFDLQTLDALTSEILESDLVDSTVYMERLQGRAVGRVTSPHSLLEVEQRLLQRWFHPQVFYLRNLRIPCILASTSYQKNSLHMYSMLNQVVDRAGSRITMARHSVYKGRDSTLAGKSKGYKGRDSTVEGKNKVYKGRDSTLAGGVLLKEGVLVSSGSKVVFSNALSNV